MIRTKSHYKFIENLYIKNDYYRNGDFKVVGRYKRDNIKIEVEDRYGRLSVYPSHLLQNKKPTIMSAIDKSSYWVNMIIYKWGNEVVDKFDYVYVDYKKSKEDITILCKLHNKEFNCSPVNHYMKLCGCSDCKSFKLKTKKGRNRPYLNIAKEVHGDRYDYSQVKEEEGDWDIICNKHGKFTQSSYNHIKGHGCKDCSDSLKSTFMSKNPTGWSCQVWEVSAEKSKNFDSYKTYIVKCWDEKESFYKIGRTYRTIQKRFKNIPYSWEVIETTVFKTAREALNKETELKRTNKLYKYVPYKKFSGHKECFK